MDKTFEGLILMADDMIQFVKNNKSNICDISKGNTITYICDVTKNTWSILITDAEKSVFGRFLKDRPGRIRFIKGIYKSAKFLKYSKLGNP